MFECLKGLILVAFMSTAFDIAGTPFPYTLLTKQFHDFMFKAMPAKMTLVGSISYSCLGPKHKIIAKHTL